MNVFKKILLSFLFIAAVVGPVFAASAAQEVVGLDDEAEEKKGANPTQIVQASGKHSTGIPEIKDIVNNKNGTLTVILSDGSKEREYKDASQYTISKVVFEFADKTRFDVPVAYFTYAPMLKALIEPSLCKDCTLDSSSESLIINIADGSVFLDVLPRVLPLLKDLHDAIKIFNLTLHKAIQKVATKLSNDLNAKFPRNAQSTFWKKCWNNNKKQEGLILKELEALEITARYFGGPIAKAIALAVVKQFNKTDFLTNKALKVFTNNFDVQEAFIITHKQALPGAKYEVSTKSLIDWGIIPDTPDVRKYQNDEAALIAHYFPLEVKEMSDEFEEVKAGEVQRASDEKVYALRDQVEWCTLPPGKLNELFEKRLPEYVKKNAGNAEFQRRLETIKDPSFLKLIYKELIAYAKTDVKQADFETRFRALPESKLKMVLRIEHVINSRAYHPIDINMLDITKQIIRCSRGLSNSLYFENITREFKNPDPYLSNLLFILGLLLEDKKVESLSLKNSSLKTLPDNIVDSLPHLKELDISENKFTSIPPCLTALQQRGVKIIGLESNLISAAELARFKAATPPIPLKKRAQAFGVYMAGMMRRRISIVRSNISRIGEALSHDRVWRIGLVVVAITYGLWVNSDQL